MQFLFSFLILFSPLGLARASDSACFRNHVLEGMELNRERRPLYSALSQGKSEKLSDALIFNEKLMVLASHTFTNFDKRVQAYTDRGFAPLCDIYISMKETPAFSKGFAGGPPQRIEPLSDHTLVSLDSDLRVLIRNKKFKEIHEFLVKHIHSLESNPKGNCMTRHLLESMARIALKIDEHNAIAQSLALPPLNRIYLSMIRGHLSMLRAFQDLDRKAIKLQLKNIPIYCQDVPAIPYLVSP